jgi:glycosyltransferase involved in cell wall biosynthesis
MPLMREFDSPISRRLAHTQTVLLLMPLATQRGGGELTLWHLLVEGRDQGVRWIVAFLEDGPTVNEVKALGISVEIIEAGRLRQAVRNMRTAHQIARFARRYQADFVFSWMPKAHIYGRLAAWLAGIPCGWFQHGTPSSASAIDRLVALLPADLVLACSKASADAQSRFWPGCSARAVHPGVELSRFDPAQLPTPEECRKQLGLPTGGPLVGIVGRLQHWKGFHVLVDAMPEILRVHPNASAVLVGGPHELEPHYPKRLRHSIDMFGLADRIIMVGAQANVPMWMQAMDIVVHASDHEPFGMVIIEAMALGKPVIATDSAGPTEIITHQVNGLLTPPGDIHALANAVIWYLQNPELARNIAVNARHRAMQFSSKKFADDVRSAIVEKSLAHALRDPVSSVHNHHIASHSADLVADVSFNRTPVAPLELLAEESEPAEQCGPGK